MNLFILLMFSAMLYNINLIPRPSTLHEGREGTWQKKRTNEADLPLSDYLYKFSEHIAAGPGDLDRFWRWIFRCSTRKSPPLENVQRHDQANPPSLRL